MAAVDNLSPSTIFSDCDTGLGPAIEATLPTMQYLHCIFHIMQNIKKCLTRSLGSRYAEFQEKFLSCRNTLFEEVFEIRFESLYNNYPEASSYLKNNLYPIKTRWLNVLRLRLEVRVREFNTGMSSTQRIESINAVDAVDIVVCIEDQLNMRQVALKSLVKWVDPSNVIEIWEVKHMGASTVSTNSLIKNRWYKKDTDLDNIDTLFDSCKGLYSSEESFADDDMLIRSSLLTMNRIQNLRNDLLNQDFEEIEHKILKQQLYGECVALGQKLAALASEFNLIHVTAILRGLIKQIEQANNNSSDNLDSSIIQNPFQVDARGRPNKRIKSSIEVDTSKSSRNKVVSIKARAGETYTCCNCSNNGHNARSCAAPCGICNKSGHTYLKCPEKENA
ncbi:7628_t:CDS:2 [Gigaspora margarita]|uniref:7628_t:CDS:1 n=1 Tax=Gigaspora margarita TaxID=4874 RepID=A0ABN7UW33_GIGMA|nr:7628_t:CDS:2 [Gigaspora margarita]